MRLLAPILLLSASMAYAVDTEEDTPPPKPTETSTQCAENQIWDPETESCIAAQDSRFNDDQRFDAARELAFAGAHDRALLVLAAASNPKDPRILNYTGFALRKSGRTAEALGYYRQALAIDPDYILARSYMGQALLDQGDVEGATTQLREIRARGGRGTWAYISLKQALSGKQAY